MAKPLRIANEHHRLDPMAQLKVHKVVGSLPDPLEASSLYVVRVGAGFDLHVTNESGVVVAYALNQSAGDVSGKMDKAVYDTNANGKVDAAEAADTVPWSGVQGAPDFLRKTGGTMTGAITFAAGQTFPGVEVDLRTVRANIAMLWFNQIVDGALTKQDGAYGFFDSFEDAAGVGSYGPMALREGYLDNMTGVGGYGADSTTTGNAIGSGLYISDAFDDNTGTAYRSSVNGAAVAYNAWVGQDFGAPLAVGQFTLRQYSNATYSVSQCALQYSDDGSSWSTATTVALVQNSSLQSFYPPNVGAHRYWRVLATSGTLGGSWYIYELQMMGALPEPAAGTFNSISITPAQAPKKATIVLDVEPMDALTINSDLVAKVTRNNSVYATVALQEVASPGGHKLLVGEADISAQPSPSYFRYRLEVAAKQMRIHAAALMGY